MGIIIDKIDGYDNLKTNKIARKDYHYQAPARIMYQWIKFEMGTSEAKIRILFNNTREHCYNSSYHQIQQISWIVK